MNEPLYPKQSQPGREPVFTRTSLFAIPANKILIAGQPVTM